MAKAETWLSLKVLLVMPAMTRAISSSLRAWPSRFLRMSSWGSTDYLYLLGSKSNAAGSSAPTEDTMTSFFRLVQITSVSPPNSPSTWRHMPHGVMGVGRSAITAMALNFLWPSATAWNTALRSAQIVAP